MNLHAALLVIDFQKSFCLKTGTLFVEGASRDIFNTVRFLANRTDISRVIETMDFHNHFHISHACFWTNKEGKNPDNYAVITLQDVEDGIWIPHNDLFLTKKYLKRLQDKGVPHIIWPKHCLAGTDGANIHDAIAEAFADWEIKNHVAVQYILKGQYWFSEQHSPFSLACCDEPENKNTIDELKQHDIIFVAGEAYTHCVKETVLDMVKNRVNPKKIVLLTNCMSSIPGYDMTGFETEMKKLGVRFMDTQEALAL